MSKYVVRFKNVLKKHNTTETVVAVSYIRLDGMWIFRDERGLLVKAFNLDCVESVEVLKYE